MNRGYSIKRVKDICRKGSSNIAQKDLEERSGIYPIYGASGLIKNVDFYQQEEECIGLVKDGSIGKVFILPPKSSVIATMQYIFPLDGYCLQYVAYCLQSLDFSKYKVGSVIPHIYFRDFGEESIYVTSNLNEQKQVVAVLDSEFERINVIQSNAETNLRNAEALFLSSVEETFNLIEAPNKTVSSLAKVSSGFAFKSTDFVPSGKYQVVRIGNVKQNHLRLFTSPVFINEEDKGVIQKSELQIGDLVVTQTGTKHKMDYGFVAMVNSEGLLLNQRVARIRFTSGMLLAKWFLYYSYTSSYKKQFFAHEGGTVGQGNVGINAITDMSFPVPDNNTIQKNTHTLDCLYEKCQALRENYTKTVSLCNEMKQALLKKAFSGTI